MKLGLIVEGHGEVQAVPSLLHRLAREFASGLSLEIPAPLRLPKGKMSKPPELQRAVELMARKTAPNGAVMIVLDADDDCPVQLASDLMQVAQAARTDRIVSVVVATREYESWLVAGAVGLRGISGLPADLEPAARVEELRDAKGWLDVRLTNGYHETTDQPRLTKRFDLNAALAAKSFAKLKRELERLSTAYLHGIPPA